MSKTLTALDKIILSQMIAAAKTQKQKNISLNIEDLLEAGYTMTEIETSIQRISQFDARKIFEETKDIPTMTQH